MGSATVDHILNRGQLDGDSVMSRRNDTINNRADTISCSCFAREGDEYDPDHPKITITGHIFVGRGNDTSLTAPMLTGFAETMAMS